MKVRELSCNPDQARRVRGALNLLVELESDPRLCDIDSDRLEEFRDKKLVTVPARENKIRLLHGTKTISQSIKAVNGTEWERISLSEQVKRLHWISAMFVWLKSRDWIDRDPSPALVKESSASSKLRRTKVRKQDSRSIFTREDLTTIFTTGEWFRTGHGRLTTAGTFREFSPYYYWLPLIGLLTGGRINELSQIFLKDIRQTEDGTWFVAIASLDDDGNLKKQKNANAERLVPIHPLLISLGLISWRNVLAVAGYTRLFPELKFDQTKGFGKAPSKWFSSYLKGLGWERDGRKVFHSFRSTLATECVNRLHLTALQTAQISGHARGDGSLVKHYIKDEIPEKLIQAVARLDFDLPAIAAFDCDAGLQAVRNALARKNKGLGSLEDC